MPRPAPYTVGSQTAGFFAVDKDIDGRLMAAFEKSLARFAHRPDVTGIDIGLKMKRGRHTGRLAIRIHVREKFQLRHLPARTRFPRLIDGVPVDVVEAVYVEHGGGPTPPARVIRPGMSVGLANRPAGTIGTIASDPAAGCDYLVSAGHVLADHAHPGAAVIQPGREDGGRAPRDQVGTLQGINRSCDAAYAVLDGSRAVDRRAEVSGVVVSGTRYPRIGDILEKSGCTTKVTRARVDGKGHFYGLKWAFRLVPLEGQMDPIAAEGDSGSVWYDPVTNEGVGIHCKGGALPASTMNFAVATSLKIVLDEWGLPLS